MKKISIFLFIIISLSAFAEFPDFFTKWDTLLKRYSSPAQREGINTVVVNYKKLKDDPSYSEMLKEIESFNPEKLETKEEKLAYWINIYNIGAAKMIVDHYPLKSIRNISTITKSVWKKDIIKISGKDYHLIGIEDDILRKMGEDRIHFAINCASLSCPDLRNEAYSPEKLEKQLAEQKILFLNDETKGLIKKGKSVHISKIFKWFKEDFSEGNLHKYLNLSKSTKIKYLKYDWSVNE